MHNLTLAQTAAALKAKEFSSEELTKHYLARIKKFDTHLNSFISVTEEIALAQAKQADSLLALNQGGPLTGIPYAHKDIFCTEDIKTTCGSKMLDNFVAPYDATVTRKLRDAGMVMLGKTNMDEFAMGSSNESSFYGNVLNPWGHDLVPGGSSGGSAACVAARIAPMATGTDTGGSIRQPASFCGITGIKPTYGLVSRFGMIAFASSLDQGGPMTQTAEDAALVLNAMTGFDALDSTSIDKPVPDYCANLNNSIAGKTIGLPKEYFGEGLDPEIKTCIDNAIKVFEKQGAIIKEISLPNCQMAIPVYYVVASAECSSNLSRYDGVRFGHRCDNPIDLEDLYKRSRAEGFGQEVKRRIMIGTYTLSAGYYDAYYLKAQKVRQLISDDFKNAFKEVDCIMGPTSPFSAFKIGEKLADPISMYLSDVYTSAVNLAGLPGMNVPCGFVNSLPVGLQIIGPHFGEMQMLNFAHQYQQQTDWHQKIPSEYQ